MLNNSRYFHYFVGFERTTESKCGKELVRRARRLQDEADRKPGSVPPQPQAAMIIPLGHTLPYASSDRTRRHRASYPYPTGGPRWDQVGVPLYLVLLRVGFTELPMSPLELVRSYRTVSPLPWHSVRPCCLPHSARQRLTIMHGAWRFVFCGTFLRVTPTGRYPAPCSMEPGLSSPCHVARSDHLIPFVLSS